MAKVIYKKRTVIQTKYIKMKERVKFMLWTIAIILIILWVLGMVTSVTMGGFIHVLIVIAIIVVLIRVIKGKNILK